eukprot:TRINITY_DN47367_c0_g1_i1.p1 TRINITY_DN47367_c0_g1~~TRINITY_DN47367_c0_g1_i1.p1  ORF type:complete len:748 (+),score=134.58 TRINITY_DN47367_c0_g1_i1:276-2246(+)
MVQAVKAAGAWSDDLLRGIKSTMDEQPAYHVVISGNDQGFQPLGSEGVPIVTTYMAESIDLLKQVVDRHLFDELRNPAAIQQAMEDPVFDRILENFFLNGDTKRAERMLLVGRRRQDNNLLHTCIKENYLETLRLLLKSYTSESHSEKVIWRVLAEPTRLVGVDDFSAFHQAVFNGRPECLQELLSWAQRQKPLIDITKLRNVKEVDLALGSEKKEGLTCLDLAEQEGNLHCYNILAPFFAVAPRTDAVDANTREARLAASLIPRVEITQEDRSKPVAVLALDGQDWSTVVAAIGQLRSSFNDVSDLIVKMCSIEFVSDATEEQIRDVLEATSGMRSIDMEGCTMQTDHTGMQFLRIVVEKLSAETAASTGRGLPSGMPSRLNVACEVSKELMEAEQAGLDSTAKDLMLQLTDRAGHWSRFLGHSFVSHDQWSRLTAHNDRRVRAAAWSSIYAPKLACFLTGSQCVGGNEDLTEWMRKLELMPLAQLVYRFYSTEKLIAGRSQDVSRGVDSAIVPCLRSVLSSWFACAPKDSDSDAQGQDFWVEWAGKLGIDDHVAKRELAPALDVVLESLLRMSKLLDQLCKEVQERSIAMLVKDCLPEALLDRLPKCRKLLSEQPVYAPPSGQSSNISLLALPTSGSLRPRSAFSAPARPKAAA